MRWHKRWGFLDAMGAEEWGRAGLMKPGNELAHVASRAHIDAGGRCIAKEHDGFVNNAGGPRHFAFMPLKYPAKFVCAASVSPKVSRSS